MYMEIGGQELISSTPLYHFAVSFETSNLNEPVSSLKFSLGWLACKTFTQTHLLSLLQTGSQYRLGWRATPHPASKYCFSAMCQVSGFTDILGLSTRPGHKQACLPGTDRLLCLVSVITLRPSNTRENQSWGEVTEEPPSNQVSPLDDGFIKQLSGRGLHDGKLLPSHKAQCRILHRGRDGADELREDSVRGQDGKGAHGVHGRLPDRQTPSVHTITSIRNRLYSTQMTLATGSPFPPVFLSSTQHQAHCSRSLTPTHASPHSAVTLIWPALSTQLHGPGAPCKARHACPNQKDSLGNRSGAGNETPCQQTLLENIHFPHWNCWEDKV